jgi:hypothetical protein
MPQSSKKTSGAAGSRTDQVRSAVDSALQAAGAQIGRERAIDLADELASAAQRVREALEELRPPTTDDLKRIARRLSAIERRLADLESAASAVAARRPGARPASSSSATKRPAAKKAAAKPKAAAAKPKAAAAKKTAAKPKTAARKPAQSRTTARRSAGGSRS